MLILLDKGICRQEEGRTEGREYPLLGQVRDPYLVSARVGVQSQQTQRKVCANCVQSNAGTSLQSAWIS